MKNEGKEKKEKIYECEVKRPFLVDGQRIRKWIRREVAQIADGDPIRCYECKGKVRLHRQRIQNGPRDHVEHMSREDSEGCPLGHYYLGTPHLSSDPTE